MATKAQNKTTKKKKAVPQKKTLKERFAALKRTLEHKEDYGDEMDMTRKENIRFIVGVVLCLVSSFIILSLVSHLFTGAEDQKIISNPDAIATNWMGSWGGEI